MNKLHIRLRELRSKSLWIIFVVLVSKLNFALKTGYNRNRNCLQKPEMQRLEYAFMVQLR